MTRVIVCGSRGWSEEELIHERLARLPAHAVIVHGAARGADQMAATIAKTLGLITEPNPAEWRVHGRRAGFVRNEEMARRGAHLCLAFWDGQSRGTAHMIACAEAEGIPIEVVPQTDRRRLTG